MKNRKKHSLWVEVYRPDTLEGYICEEELREKIEGWIATNDIPHMTLAGPAGTGKTTLAKIIVKNLKCDYLYINASDENGIDTVREKVKGFAEAASFEPLKVVILDEADFFTQPAQAALRNLIEDNSASTRFILTCNYAEKIIEPLASRCKVRKVVPPSKGAVAQHAATILDKEQVKYELKQLVPVINTYYPDIRSVIGELQDSVKNGVFGFNVQDDSFGKQLISLLVKNGKTAWADTRQLIVNEQLDEYQSVYRMLYDSIDTWGKSNAAELIITIDEYMWRANSCPDKEINCAACVAKILEIINR